MQSKEAKKRVDSLLAVEVGVGTSLAIVTKQWSWSIVQWRWCGDHLGCNMWHRFMNDCIESTRRMKLTSPLNFHHDNGCTFITHTAKTKKK